LKTDLALYTALPERGLKVFSYQVPTGNIPLCHGLYVAC